MITDQIFCSLFWVVCVGAPRLPAKPFMKTATGTQNTKYDLLRAVSSQCSNTIFRQLSVRSCSHHKLLSCHQHSRVPSLPPQVMSCPICVYLLTNEFFVSRVVTVLKVTAAHNMSSDTARLGQHQHKHSISFSFQTQKLDHWLLKQLELYQEYLGRQPGSWVANTSAETLTRQLACQ